MYPIADGVSFLAWTDGVMPGFALARGFLGLSLPFSPVRIICLIGWVYLCIYSIQRIEYGSLISSRWKPVANIFSLLIGPLLLFVLIVADTSRRIQEGESAPRDILKMIFGNAFRKRKRGRLSIPLKPIELMDSSGKSFHEIYGHSETDNKSDSEILELTESIILDSINARASDILIDPKSDGVYTLRFRVDGLLKTISQIDAEKCAAVVNSIKAVSSMDISERRRPQDGSFMAKTPEGNVYFRVAGSGVLGGEKLTIRVLNQSTGILKLDEIGLSKKNFDTISDIVKQSSGMVIVCGPTGSGKSTSLYAMLDNIDFFTRNVITIEDPIEYVLHNASQIEINVKADITFANTLRSILRQDPDVISVGEIRDSETARMAIQASQTGHLVLATLHSSSNMAALVRMMDLGVKPLLLASALSVIISQRLVRKLCNNCKTPAQLDDSQIAYFKKKGKSASTIMMPNGCKECGGAGFLGRTAILDVMYLDDDIKANLIDNKMSIGDLKKQGDQKSKSTLRKEGLKKVMAGITTLEEIKRVTSKLG